MSIRLLDELDDLEKLSLIPMSYSRLNTYSMCQAQYFFSYVTKDEQVFGPAATLGNIIHAALEEKLPGNEPFSEQHHAEIVNEYFTQRRSYDPESLIPDKLIEDGESMLQDFFDRHEGEVFKVAYREKPFNIVVGPALIRGYIDRVDMEDNLLIITDYKSGKQEVAAKNVHENLQLGLYAMAMAHEYPDKQIYAQLYYLRSGRIKGHLFSRDDLLACESRFTSLVKEVIDRRNFNPTGNTRICSFCDFAQTGVCSVGAKRLKRFNR